MEENKTSVGPIIGTIIIIALIVLGGLYFWGKRIEETKLTKTLTSEEPQNEQMSEAAAIISVGTSTNINDIEADLNNTNTTNLDTELNTTAPQAQ